MATRTSKAERLGPQVDAAVENGGTVREACAAVGLTESTYYRWRATAAKGEGDVPVRRDVARARRAIEQTARAVFLRIGYAASIDEIAEAAGVSRQTIYNIYGDKAGLFESTIERLYADIHIVTHVEERGTLAQTLYRFARRYMDAAFDPDMVGFVRLLMRDSETFPHLTRDLTSPNLRTSLEALIIYMTRIMAEGRIRTADPKIAAEAFVGALRGHARQRMLMGIDNGPERSHRRAVARFVTQGFLQAMEVGGKKIL